MISHNTQCNAHETCSDKVSLTVLSRRAATAKTTSLAHIYKKYKFQREEMQILRHGVK